MRSLAIIALLASPALADSYEEKATGAARLAHLDDLVWAATDKCDRADDVQTRQCKKLRDDRLASLSGKPLIVDGPALVVGPWNAAKKSADVSIASCVFACDDPKAVKVITGPAPIVTRALPFADAAARDAFATSNAAAKTQLVVQLAAKQAPGAVALDVLAFRVVTPCDGKIVIAQPGSQPLPADPKSCPKK